jgi:hypothetical protein
MMETQQTTCPSCNYPIDSKNYMSFLIWADQHLVKNDTTKPCHRCEAPDDYRKYVKKCVSTKGTDYNNLINETWEARVSTTHLARANVEYIIEDFYKLVDTINVHELRELIQYMCIFPSVIMPYHYIKMVQYMKHACRKFGLTEYNTFKQRYDRWWAKEYKNDIKTNISLVREILFPNCRQLVGIRKYHNKCGCSTYFRIKMTKDVSEYEDSSVIEEEPLIDDKSFEEIYNANPEHHEYIVV